MTPDNRIKWNLQQIARVATDKDYFREWGAEAIVHYIRDVLGTIEELLQEPEHEPETLAGSVLRLTDTCNALEGENRKLKEQVEQFRIGWCPLGCVRSDQSDQLKLLKERNDRLVQNLNECGTYQANLRKAVARRDKQLAKVHNQLKEALRILKESSG